MNKSFTTSGHYIEPSVDPNYFKGPSISREEQIRRLSALRAVKGLTQKRQMEIGESIFKK